jgi:predicted HTH domain antitoxin
MKLLTLSVPDTLDIDNQEMAMIVATSLYEQGKLSLGQAAEVAGLTKRAFTELLGKYNVSIFNYPISDLSKDITNA